MRQAKARVMAPDVTSPGPEEPQRLTVDFSVPVAGERDG
jgi:hypothetical protein